MQDTVMEGQQRRVKVQYARDRNQSISVRPQTSEAAINALQVLQHLPPPSPAAATLSPFLAFQKIFKSQTWWLPGRQP